MKWVFSIFAASFLLATPAAMAAASTSTVTPEIWLGPVDPVTRAARKWDASADYIDLFRLDSSWKAVAASFRVFKIGPGFVQQGKEADLQLIFSELKKHNIKLALEIGMGTRSEHCNQNTEAYGAPGLVERPKGCDIQAGRYYMHGNSRWEAKP
jgi:hypothetical protein